MPLTIVRSQNIVTVGFAPNENVEELVDQKLSSSGLTLDDAHALGMVAYAADQTQKLYPNFWALPSLTIPYYDLDGKPMSAAPGWPQFYRVRALRKPVPEPKKFAKYLQVPDTGVCAYFPRTVNWRELLKDYRKSIIITEGELKAAKACKEGFLTIGLGGVDSWRTKTFGHAILPELREIDWIKRDAIIAFDSDMMSNPNVIRALRSLAEMLQTLGALPKIIMLPDGDAGKTGLDDFLVARGGAQFELFLAHHSKHLTLATTLWDLNDDYAYIKATGEIVEIRSGDTSKPDKFKVDLTEDHYENVVKDNGEIFMQRQSAAEAWLKWRMRSNVERMVYEPALSPKQIIEHDGSYCYNCWPGWACKPKAGDVALFTKLVDHLFGNSLEEKKWFLQWLAYPIQHPGTKLFTTPLIWSRNEGIGKSYLPVLVGDLIYGKNYTIVVQSEFQRTFQEWAVRKQFILVDDVAGGDKKAETEKIKPMITRPTIWVNIKNKSSYEIRDCINYMWTSNHQDAFFLSDKDRRFFVFESKAKPLPDSFFNAVHDWSKSPEAGPALFHYMLSIDLAGFSPHARAPDTQSKNEMRSAGMVDVAQWCRDLAEDPEGHLQLGDIVLTSDLLTLRQIRECYDFSTGLPSTNLSNKRLGIELRSSGVEQVNLGKPMRVAGVTGVDRYYAVRNAEKWINATLEELQEHIVKNSPKGARRY